MKTKLLSLILSGAVLAGAAAFEMPLAQAAQLDMGAYTFVDTVYSPELGVYMAMAKDLTSNTTPSRVYTSTDMERWTLTRSDTSAIHYANKETRQNIVWWEAQQVFAMQVSNKLLISHDGISWEAVSLPEANSTNVTLATNGDVLVVSGKTTIRAFKNLDEVYAEFSIDSTPDNATYSKAIGVTPKEPYSYVITDQYRTWRSAGGDSVTTGDRNIGATPYDMIWSDKLNGWIVVNGTAVFRVMSGNEISYTEFTSMQLSDGTVNSDKYTAAGVSENYVVAGTDLGHMYIAPNDSNSFTTTVLWETAQPGLGEELSEQVRSITDVGSDRFLVASATKLLLLENDGSGWKYYDTATADINVETTRVEIPESGNIEIPVEPVNLNCKGEVSDDPIISFEMTSDLPEGISFDQTGMSGMLTVDSSVTGGHEITFHAATEGGREKDITITIVDADHIEIIGNDEMAIPWEGEEPEVYTYTAVVIGTDGQPITRVLSLKPAQIPEGIDYDEETGTFTVSAGVSDCEIVLEASLVNYPDAEKEIKNVAVTLRAPRRAEFVKGNEALYIPDSDTAEFEYAVKFYDQIGKEMATSLPVWSITPLEIEQIDEVSIDPQSGVLSVGSKAVLGTITVTAVSELGESVKAEMTVTLQYTDLRKAQEDQAEFALDTSAPVTDDLVLLNTRTFGSKIRWRSSDESLIATDGKVNRNSREDKKVTFTETVTNGKATLERDFELVVKKAENLFINGDIEDGTAEGWEADDSVELTAAEEDGLTVLKVSGGGVYQKIALTNNSSYAFEANIKAPAQSVVKLVSEKAGTLIEYTSDGSWQNIKTTYDYRNQNSSFEDTIYIECTSDFTIDNVTVYEITLELNEVMTAVNKAKYSKVQKDVDSARALVEAFYDLPIKEELLKELDKINVSGSDKPSGGSGGGGGGGGGGSTSGSAPSKVEGTTHVNDTVPVPGNDDKESTADALDTFLLNFKDMKTHWARKEVEFLGGLGIITGDDDGNFRPDDKITRAEFATLTARAIGLSEIPYENSYYDVLTDDWYSGWVQTCRTNNLMNGYDGLFSPQRNITREEIAKTVVSAYNLKSGTQLVGGKSLYFNDIDQISSWAYDYIAEAADKGFVNGVTDELFMPKREATRAEAAVMLKRVYDELNGTGESEEPTETPAPQADTNGDENSEDGSAEQ